MKTTHIKEESSDKTIQLLEDHLFKTEGKAREFARILFREIDISR